MVHLGMALLLDRTTHNKELQMFSASTKVASGNVAATLDPQFNYVTMLLHGDGTNGAQNNTFLDSSSNNYTVTRTGNVTQGSFSPYGSNWSNYFGSASDANYLTIPANAAFDLGSGNFTIEMWVYKTTTGSQQFLAQVALSVSAINQSIGVGTYYDQVSFDTAVGSTYYSVTTAASLTLNAWNHIACVRNGSTLTVYINGTSAGTGSVTGSLNSISAPMTIGRLGNYNGYYTTGYISNLRIVKGTAVYTSNFTPSTTPLTAISGTSLLTCQSNRYVDNSANNFTITVNTQVLTSPSVQRFNPFGTSTAYSTSVIGGSGYFNGVAYNYLQTTGTVGIANSAFTICCWFYPLNSSVVGLFDSGPSQPNCFRNFNINEIEMQAQGTKVTITGAYQVNAWNWMCITKSGTSYTVYINGTSVGSATCATNMFESNFTIGGVNLGNNGAFYGYISDFQVLNTSTVVTVPTTPITNASGKTYLLNFQNGAIFDNAMMNNLETLNGAQISTSVVKYGTGSLYFNGSNAYLKQATSPQLQNYQLGSGDFTIESWIYKTANGVNGYDNLMQLGTNGNATDGFFIEISSLRGYVFAVNNTTIVSYNVNPNTSAWQHFAVCKSGNNTRMFVNGTQVSSTYTSNYTVPSTGTLAIIGADGSTTLLFNGYVDEFRITKGYARYTANFTPPNAAFFNTGPY